jgi:hypothetical protein
VFTVNVDKWGQVSCSYITPDNQSDEPYLVVRIMPPKKNALGKITGDQSRWKLNSGGFYQCIAQTNTWCQFTLGQGEQLLDGAYVDPFGQVGK